MRNGILRFFGELRAVVVASPLSPASSAMSTNSGAIAPESTWSNAVCHGFGEPSTVSGEGSGVMSTSGPTPGEENAELGDRELARCLEAESTEPKLSLREGKPMEDEAWYMGISISFMGGVGKFIDLLFGFGLPSRLRVVWRCRPALSGLGGCGDTIVGYVCGGVVSRGWRDALYWKGGDLDDRWVEGVGESIRLLLICSSLVSVCGIKPWED